MDFRFILDKMKAKIKELSFQIAVLMIFNGLLAECSLLKKLQTRLREKFKGNFPYSVLKWLTPKHQRTFLVVMMNQDNSINPPWDMFKSSLI